MAYENGYEVIDYIGETIKRYREDKTLFFKALSLFQTFSMRSDWPYCFDELEQAMLLILGDYLSNLIGFTQKYIDDNNMIWPEDLPQHFREELKSFHLATYHIVNQFLYGRVKPYKLFCISEAKNPDNIRVVRFIRYDGQSLDLEMDKQDLDVMIEMLSQLKARDEHEEK